MCRAITCRICGKPDWAGCGAHVEQVLGHVATEDRCPRNHTREEAGTGGGLLKRLFGR
jgi:hypothetical protein